MNQKGVIVMNKATVIKGIIVPNEWDDKDNVISVAIATAGEREYPIEMNGMGKSLLKNISQQVRLEGVIDKNRGYNCGIISVNSYQILNWEAKPGRQKL